MRQFGIIASSLWRSKRFRALKSDIARLTYVYLHTSSHGNSVGSFVMPAELAAIEMRRDPEQVREALSELATVRLIRLDPEEELIQIVNFFRFNAPSSRKQLAGPLRIVREHLPASPVRDTTACDLCVAIYRRAMTWDKTVDARAAFLDEAARLVMEHRLHDLLASDEIGADKGLLIALSDDLLINLPIQGQGKADGQQTQTQTDTQTQTHTQTETGSPGPDRARSGPPSPPAKGSRSGRKLPEEVRRTIDSLGKG